LVRACLLALLPTLLLSACGGYVEPGPRPARVAVSVRAQVDGETIRQAVQDRLGPPPYVPGWFHQLAPAPVWDWNLYLVRPDGELRRLEPEPGAQLAWVPGTVLEGQAVFLVPPGRHRLRLLAEAAMEHTYSDAGGFWREYIPLVSHQRRFTLTVGPGEQKRVKADFTASP
jgi:hypothetical protein